MNIYFEPQRLQHCAKHTLNNLLQRERFTKADLDALADELAAASSALEASGSAGWWGWLGGHPHRSLLGLGNFDVNVLEAALLREGLHVVWMDARRDVRRLRLNAVFGLVLNVATFWGRHWLALRRIDGVWYNLDSKQAAPAALDDDDALFALIGERRARKDAQLLVVTEGEMTQDALCPPAS
eukprot:Unigene7163_Nuclearia_a/m.21976 Unigene7163_Nuclearia_a/g.21976  ORF Unigene7163_Nuclearia_a/g.21976 Unigene7163_Nuclearia_a/m.21976 type:complete len:183 (-) Unigene7163_Nuclearia_a:2-550(-)